MGNDAALAVLSDRQPPLFSYFKQLFAQVTNPADRPDPRGGRDEPLAALGSARRNLFDRDAPATRISLLPPADPAQPRAREGPRVDAAVFETHTIDMTWPCARARRACRGAGPRLRGGATTAVEDGARPRPLRPQRRRPDRAPIPTLLATAAVHHHLVRAGTRLRAGLVVESGEPREIHHMATLIGYGAERDQPLPDVGASRSCTRGRSPGDRAIRGGRGARSQAIDKGLLKMISKMGISTICSYCGAQIFEAVGLERELVDR